MVDFLPDLALSNTGLFGKQVALGLKDGKQGYVLVSPSIDLWALGVIALAIFSGESAIPKPWRRGMKEELSMEGRQRSVEVR